MSRRPRLRGHSLQYITLSVQVPNNQVLGILDKYVRFIKVDGFWVSICLLGTWIGSGIAGYLVRGGLISHEPPFPDIEHPTTLNPEP